ncbi:universal stress protein [Candidatus Berkiella aquae]|uniref:Universal stress protein n=1 Tax=Candidatus Berkiella aquae TaxID=295108 RepID=A0A0Q9YTL6_9GAMM|nr:universal stress protein [Candidatus Berkiella aquae]MCS5709988.1 universal stress protein [Candidatus Berkiella aquae]
MYKRILVAIDGSNPAKAALSQAIALASVHDAKLVIIHVIDFAGISGGFKHLRNDSLNDMVCNQAEKVLAQAKQQAQKKKINAQTILIELNDYQEQIAEKILAQAITSRAQLLVMGTQGLRGLVRIVLGSVTDYVIRHSSIPVLIVPDKKKAKRART